MRTVNNHAFILLLLLTAVVAISCSKEMPPVNVTEEGVAIKGYDTVAYFKLGRAVKGSPEFEFTWMGAVWRFQSDEHRREFAENPGKYAPQYGGYCAYAVSRGSTADIDPEAWSIVNGKLYLNRNREVKKLWWQDVPGNIKKADENWPGLL